MIDVAVLTADDWRLWRDLRLAALTDAPSAFGATRADWIDADEHRWRYRLESVPFNIVLSIAGRPVGMVGATSPAAGAVELISMWVSPSARGRGVGDEAVRRVVGWAAAEHPGASVELSVRADNVAARRLYERNEFVDIGVSADNPADRRMRR